MNDMTFLCQTAISRSGGLARTDLWALNRRFGATSTAPAASGLRSSSPSRASLPNGEAALDAGSASGSVITLREHHRRRAAYQSRR
jgi:hypothetical protein